MGQLTRCVINEESGAVGKRGSWFSPLPRQKLKNVERRQQMSVLA